MTAVKLLMALLMAIAFACAAALARRVVPDPWATGAALIALALSPPAVVAATSIRPEARPRRPRWRAPPAPALRVRDDPRAVTAFWAALLVATVPWLGMSAALPAIVVASALAHWLRRLAARARRVRGAGGRLPLGGRVHHDQRPALRRPHALREPALSRRPRHGDPRPRGPPRAAWGRLGELLGELVLWAPFALLAFAALWLLWRSRARAAVARSSTDQVHVEVVAAFP